MQDPASRSRATPFVSTQRSTTEPFPQQCKRVLQVLRGALATAVAELGLDPARPQQLARELGLHRHLTLKISRIVTGTDVFAAVSHVPSPSSMGGFLRALGKKGVSAGAIEGVERAMVAFDDLVRTHAGDRATLDLVASGFVPGGAPSEALFQARRAAFRANSATWSVQTRVHVATNIMAPNAGDPSRVDMGLVNGRVDFRRLRPDIAWPLFRRTAWDETGSSRLVEVEPILPEEARDGVPLLAPFCSPDLPELRRSERKDCIEFELPPGPVGRTGEVTCMLGTVVRSLGSQHADEHDRVCEVTSKLILPSELLQLDLIVHESLSWARNPECSVRSLLEGRPVHGKNPTAMTLPVENDVHELGFGLATMATPHVPRYTELLACVFDRLGWNADEFLGFRFSLEFPPIPSSATLSMDLLPERGS
jgi:hypothetical protein